MAPLRSPAAGPISRRRLLQGASGAVLLAELGLVRRRAAAADPGEPTRREAYALDPSITYLNHASIGTVPNVVLGALAGYQQLCETNPWLYMWSDPWREPLAEVRAAAAGCLGCAADEVAIVHNTTEVFNTLSQGLPIGPGDEVLFSSLNHPGASICWEHQAARRGFEVRRFEWPIAEVGAMTRDAIVDRYAAEMGPRTRVVVLPHVDNMVGLRHPVAEIAAAARERGARWVLVDGAQSVNVVPVDVTRLGVDAYATSAHKWTQAPKGLGFTYLRRDRQPEVAPMWVTWGQRIWKDDARAFEDYGTRALPSVIALGDALRFQARLDPAAREARHRATWEALRRRVAARPDLIWRSPVDWTLAAPLCAIEPRAAAADVAHHLFDRHGVVVRPFTTPQLDALRLSPNLSNDDRDLERCLTAIAA